MAAPRVICPLGRTAAEVALEAVPLVVIQHQLRHGNLGITSIYLQGIDNAEIIDTSMPTVPL